MAMEEDVFMQTLLDGLDTSTTPTSYKSKEINAVDLSILLDGAENWDWADMEADFMTPKKKSASLKNVSRLVLDPHFI